MFTSLNRQNTQTFDAAANDKRDVLNPMNNHSLVFSQPETIEHSLSSDNWIVHAQMQDPQLNQVSSQ